jgi:hypothetical protein
MTESRNTLDEQLQEAVSMHDFSRALKLLQAGADPNAPIGNKGARILTAAIRQGAPLAFCHAVLEHGAELSPSDPNDQDPLSVAATYGKLEMCRDFIGRGAVINRQVGDRHDHALSAAVFNGQLEVARLLIESGADVLAENSRGEIALHYVDGPFGDRPILGLALAELLVREGASPSHRPTNPASTYLTPFQGALRGTGWEIIQYFIYECGEDPAQLTIDGKTMVEIAANDRARELILAAHTGRSVEDALGSPDAVAKAHDSTLTPL